NAYMSARLGESVVPAYPGTCHVVWLGPSAGGGFVGSGPRLPPLQFIVKRLPDLHSFLRQNYNWIFSNGTPVYPVVSVLENAETTVADFIAAHGDIDDDANPAFVIAELLCARWGSLGPRLTPFAIDWDSFMRSAERLKAEGMGISFAWQRTRSIRELIDDICKQINAVVDTDERTNRITLRLIRETDEAVHTFDNSNIVAFDSAKRAILTEAPNEVQVIYPDRALQYESRTLVAKNTALIQQAGAVVSKEFQYIGVSSARVAS